MKTCIYFIIFIITTIYAIKLTAPHADLLDNISFSQVIYDENHHLLRLTLTPDQKYRLYTPLNRISPIMIQATLLQEDQYFYHHLGVNPLSIIKAGWQTYIVHHRQFGASTITMQLARNYYHINSKTVPGKFNQIIRALELELFYSKKQILEAYFNLVPYGGNIEGVGAASLIYFNKQPNQLLLPDAMTLSVIPQNPRLRNPAINQNAVLQAARLKLFQRWITIHPQDKSQQMLMSLPLQATPTKPLFLAPHFCDEVLQQHNNSNSTTAHKNENCFNTTLNISLQKSIEKIVDNYLLHQQQYGIENAAVILIDTRDMGVKALVGSGDFFNNNIQGQVNGTDAIRSPGSTLKPFIYALALDQGLIHPYTVLEDAPTHFGAYDPENFDNNFVGPIKAKDALILSRNVPAIELANQLQNPDLYQFLISANFKYLKSEDNYGLSLVLGSAGVSMQELISLYAMLANQGELKPLRFELNQPIISEKKLLSPEAAFLTLDMLKDTTRPNPVSNYALNQLPVYWKTGTSSAYRDAWSVGIFGPYALAVWIGDFPGKSNPAYVGITAAAPLFFEIIDAINQQFKPLPSIMPNPQNLHLTRVQVCEASGMLPNRYCPNLVTTWFIPGKSPITTDNIYRAIAIDNKTGLRTCHYDNNTQWVVYEFWPSNLLKIFNEAGIHKPLPPPFEAGCDETQFTSGTAPKIISPQAGLIYSQRLLDMQSTILFNASADADVNKLYWFVDNNFIGSITPHEYISWPEKSGHFIIRVIDDHGRSDTQDLIVENTE